MTKDTLIEGECQRIEEKLNEINECLETIRLMLR